MANSRLNFHILGPQGSGKGTQSEILAERLKFSHLSAGQLFRDRIEVGDELAKKLKTILDSGQLVPLNIYQQIIESAIVSNQQVGGFIFDGAIRNLQQVQCLEKIWKKYHLLEPWLIVINLSDEEAIRRIEKRLTCSSCKSIFIADGKLQENLTCPQCQGVLKKRSDDDVEVVKKRLETYYTQTLPVVDYFRSKDRLVEIDGRPSIDDVSEQIFNKLQEKNILSYYDLCN